MSRPEVFLTGASYVLGEVEVDHDAVPGLWDRARELKMAPSPKLWGWGSIRRTGKSLEKLAIETGVATLAAAGVEPSSVDMLVLCSTRFPGGAETHGRFVETIMTGIGLDRADFVGVTLNRCTNLLSALRVAEALVASGIRRRVLVVTTDRVTDEATRMETFALFSDGAASCLVGAEGTGPDRYELVASAAATDVPALDWSHEISSDLARDVNEQLLAPRQLTVRDVAGLSQANLFRPLVVMKELQAGFTPRQIYTDNIPRVGHCFAADPLINLVDRAAMGDVSDGELHLLAASVPGARIGVLLRRLAAVSVSGETGSPSGRPVAVASAPGADRVG